PLTEKRITMKTRAKKAWLNTVLVKMKPIEKVSRGGIIISTDAEEKRDQRATDEAYVLDYGPLVPEEAQAPIGSLALVPRYAGNDLWEGDILYRVLHYDNIVCLLGD